MDFTNHLKLAVVTQTWEQILNFTPVSFVVSFSGCVEEEM